ncbi:MAG: N-acetyl-gamma-glutamyl-phosphate reductase [Verrucomicrobiaceae bacterium]
MPNGGLVFARESRIGKHLISCHFKYSQMSHPTKVAIVGASGYTGLELLKILFCHPNVEVVAITSRANAGESVSTLFPRFQDHPGTNLTFIEPNMDTIASTGAEVAFLALPHGAAAPFARELLNLGIKVIDLSADFRLEDPEVYADFYDHPHPAPELLKEAVFGLPEVHGDQIKGAKLIASPGCYPTSIMLPLIPLLRENLIEMSSITISSMSGVSGAGRNASIPLIFAECNESVRSYGLPRHRHLSEIEQELGKAAGEQITVCFVPHLIPVTAGICTTIFATLKGTGDEVNSALQKAYQKAPFVRLRGEGVSPDTKHVVGTNYLDIGWHFDRRTGRIILQSAEDNLGKGAAGQAVQSFNLLVGNRETDGLQRL